MVESAMIGRIVVDLVILLSSTGIVVVHVALYGGLAAVLRSQRRGRRTGRSGTERAHSVCLVVPARNEAEGLPRLFASFERQTRRDFSVVLIDDRSSDGTPSIMEEFSKRHDGMVKIIRLSAEDAVPGRNPKQNALTHGVARADAEILLFTDADCEVPPTWIEDMAACYDDESLGLVIGAIITRQDGGAASRFHAFDHIFKYAYTAGSIGIGLPTGGFGNNLSIRRAALDEVGGFEALGNSTTEDAALIAAVRVRTSWRVGALLSERTLVRTAPLASFREIASQEVRWHIGGLFSTDVSTRLSYGYLMLYLTASIAAVAPSFFHPLFAVMPATSFLTMGVMALIAGAATSRPVRPFWRWFLPDLILTMCFNAYLTVRALTRRRVTWKGSTLG